MAGFGTPISSIPNTSWQNVTAPVSYVGSTGATPTASTGMDPISIGLGVAGLGASIFGASAQQKAADKAAKATEEAARIAAASTEKAAETGAKAQIAGQLGGFGIDYLTQRYNSGAGGFANRWNALMDAQQDASFQANNPDLITLRSVQKYSDRLSNAMPGYMPPTNLFG
jgi:hypothetical protein